MSTLKAEFIQDLDETVTFEVADFGAVAKTDTAQSWTTPQRAGTHSQTTGTIDMDVAQNFIYTPSGDQTLSFTNETIGQLGIIYMINSGHTITLGAEIMAPDGMATSISVAGEYLISYFVQTSGGGAGTVKLSFIEVV